MQLTHLQSYERPVNLPAAIDALRSGGRGTRLMAAGTDLVLSGSDEITGVVDLGGLGLSYVEDRGGSLIIGATTTLADLLKHPATVAYLGGVVTEMLERVGTPLLRNTATVGGNLVRRQPWSDVIPLFRALDASVTLFDGETRTIPIDDLYEGAAHLTGSILTEIVLPRPPHGTGAAFWKFTRSEVDIATLNCAAMISTDGERCARARIYVGATPRLAVAARAAGEALESSDLSDEAISAAGDVAAGEIVTGNDLRADAAYRTRLVRVGVTRCLAEARARAWEAGA
jgi:CO/xanthine dehydrogenase FAD-binding subunit